jgi:hypothetical protein
MLVISIITVLYTGRMFVMLFHRNDVLEDESQKSLEPSLTMKLPFWILSAGALAIVFAWQPFDFTTSWIFNILQPEYYLGGHMAILILSMAVIAIGLITVFFVQFKIKKDFFNPESVISKTLQSAFYADDIFIYSGKSSLLAISNWSVIIESFWLKSIVFLKTSWVVIGITLSFFDRYIIDGLVNGLSSILGYFGSLIKGFQSGRLGTYLMLLILFLLIGLLLILIGY